MQTIIGSPAQFLWTVWIPFNFRFFLGFRRRFRAQVICKGWCSNKSNNLLGEVTASAIWVCDESLIIYPLLRRFLVWLVCGAYFKNDLTKRVIEQHLRVSNPPRVFHVGPRFLHSVCVILPTASFRPYFHFQTFFLEEPKPILTYYILLSPLSNFDLDIALVLSCLVHCKAQRTSRVETRVRTYFASL
jgi:hypothetical protein